MFLDIVERLSFFIEIEAPILSMQYSSIVVPGVIPKSLSKYSGLFLLDVI